MEKTLKPMSGYVALLLALALVALSIFFIFNINNNAFFIPAAIISMVAVIFLVKGLMIIHPNHSRVLNFFGRYVGSVKDNGLFFINPLYTSYKITLRAQNLQGHTLKVNDKMGNPIEIAAVIVWRVRDNYSGGYGGGGGWGY